MGKSRGQVTTVAPDAATQAYSKQVYDAAGAAGNGGPGADAARSFYGDAMKAGNLGFGALSGDPAATSQLMNPYLQNVMQRVQSQFGDLNALTSKGINDQATLGGAFGGSRHGIAEGVALAQNAKTAQDQLAQLAYGGFNDTMGRAGQLANLGFGAAGQLPQLDPATMRLMALKAGQAGTPYGTTTTTPTNRNAGAGVLGGAIAGAQLGTGTGGPGWGTLIGGGLGGLLGLFGS